MKRTNAYKVWDYLSRGVKTYLGEKIKIPSGLEQHAQLLRLFQKMLHKSQSWRQNAVFLLPCSAISLYIPSFLASEGDTPLVSPAELLRIPRPNKFYHTQFHKIFHVVAYNDTHENF